MLFYKEHEPEFIRVEHWKGSALGSVSLAYKSMKKLKKLAKDKHSSLSGSHCAPNT
jgi:hypothetical protein